MDHGRAELRLTQKVDESLDVLNRVQALGIDYTELTETLQREGVAAFAQSFDNLLIELAAKSREDILESAD